MKICFEQNTDQNYMPKQKAQSTRARADFSKKNPGRAGFGLFDSNFSEPGRAVQANFFLVLQDSKTGLIKNRGSNFFSEPK